MNNRTTFIFDGDDTLWKTHYLYEKVKTQTATLLNAIGVKVDRDVFVKKVDEIGVVYGKKYGFINKRFPTALTEAYKFFCLIQQINPDKETIETIWGLGTSVATMKPEIMPKAREVLEKLSKNNNCILYTLGNEDEQLFRLNSVSLAHYFKDIFVVLHKNEATLAQLLSKLDLDPELTWMIGNSASNDIKPAVKKGLNCIWLHSEHWLLDDADLDTSQIYEIKSLIEIHPIIETWEHKRG
jgi:putative hydrolase of the HAD superfamily